MRRLSRRRNHHATPVSRRPTKRMDTRDRTLGNVEPGVGSTLRASASCVGVGEIGVASSLRAPFSSSGSTCTFGGCGFSFAMDELGRTRVVTRACALRTAFESATVDSSRRPSGSVLLDADPPDAAAAVAVPASLPPRGLPPYPCKHPSYASAPCASLQVHGLHSRIRRGSRLSGSCLIVCGRMRLRPCVCRPPRAHAHAHAAWACVKRSIITHTHR